jgi:Zn-dependent protease
VGLNWSWLVIVALIVLSLAADVFPTENPGLSDGMYVAMAVVAALLFFASLFLHELGHAVVARREGMEIEGITLWLFGGVARFKGMFPSAGAEFRIAIAGPLVTLVLGGLFLFAAWLLPLPSVVDGVVSWLGYVNLFLLAFNMLPALPLDGGRVLRATVWYLRGDFAQATRFAGTLGRVFGQAMIAFGIIGALVYGAAGGLWLALIGWFLTVAASSEASLVAARQALAGLRVADAMTAEPVVAPAAATLREFMEQVFAHSRHSAYPVVDGDRVMGIVSFRSVAAVPASDWDRLKVSDRMLSLEQALVLNEDAGLGDALPELLGTDLGRAIVRTDDRPTGLLSLTDVQRLLELRQLTARRT